MLAGLPLGAALYWWSQMVHGSDALEGPFPPVWWADHEGEPHPDSCRCLDCDPDGFSQAVQEAEDES